MMAFVVDQQSNGYKHFCKICNKGFICGRALGGHMCTHGIGDHSFHLEDDDDDPGSAWDNNNIDVGGNSRRMYALRTNSNRLKSCRTCENCCKEFSSLKSFLEQGKCGTSDDLDESLALSLGGSEEDECYDDEDDGDDGRRGCRWSKRKRSMRVMVDNFGSICPSSEDEDLANSLMMLSSGMVDNPTMAEQEESCASASRDENHRRPPPVSFIPRLTYRSTTTMDKAKGIGNNNNNNGIFECKDCKKVFNSHQALGGHRASHKKVKGCFAARIDREYDYAPDDNALTSGEFFRTKSTSTLPFDHGPFPSSSKKKSKVHECSICHRVFLSGQALGGHKRSHWITSNGAVADVPSLAKLASLQVHLERIQQQRPSSFINVDHNSLDLNLPASLTTDARNFDKVASTEMYLRSWLGFDAKEIRECNNPSAGNDCDSGVNKANENNVTNNCGPLTDNNHDNNSNSHNFVNVADDEADSKVKLAKLSELNDTKISGSSFSWLQVGIGSTAAKDEAATSAGASPPANKVQKKALPSLKIGTSSSPPAAKKIPAREGAARAVPKTKGVVI